MDLARSERCKCSSEQSRPLTDRKEFHVRTSICQQLSHNTHPLISKCRLALHIKKKNKHESRNVHVLWRQW